MSGCRPRLEASHCCCFLVRALSVPWNSKRRTTVSRLTLWPAAVQDNCQRRGSNDKLLICPGTRHLLVEESPLQLATELQGLRAAAADSLRLATQLEAFRSTSTPETYAAAVEAAFAENKEIARSVRVRYCFCFRCSQETRQYRWSDGDS